MDAPPDAPPLAPSVPARPSRTSPPRRRKEAQRRLRRWRVRILVRSALVGLAATGLDVLALRVLIDGAGLSPRVANAPALLFGVAAQYLGNKYLAFRDDSDDHLRQGALFALVEVGTLVLNFVGFDVLVTHFGVPYYVARPVVTLAVYLLFSFPLWARIFRPR